MKCKLKTITPVHIGSGESYSPSEYINSRAKLKGKPVNTIKRVDVSKLYSKLDDDEKDDYIYHLSSYSMALDDYFKDRSKLPSDVYRYTALKRFNEEKIKVNEIKENIKTLDKSYIPGSSIKGSIRTAIAYDLIEERDIDDINFNLRNGRYSLSWNSKQMIENLFHNNNNERKYPYYSLMRFLQVTDSNTVDYPYIYAVLTKKATQRNSMENHKRNGNIVYNFLETIPANKNLAFDINVNYDSNVHRKINLREKESYFDMDTLKEVIYNFSKDYIEYEQDFAYNYRFKLFQDFYKDLEAENTKKEPLMLIGSGTGFMSKTIGMKIKKSDPLKFEEIRKSARKSYEYEFPKSRRIITRGGKPLGWVKLITK